MANFISVAYVDNRCLALFAAPLFSFIRNENNGAADKAIDAGIIIPMDKVQHCLHKVEGIQILHVHCISPFDLHKYKLDLAALLMK